MSCLAFCFAAAFASTRASPSDFTLSFPPLVQYIGTAAAHVPCRLICSLSFCLRLFSLLRSYTYGRSARLQWFFRFFLPHYRALYARKLFFLLPHFFQHGYWADKKKVKFCSQWIISLSRKTPPGFSHQPARMPACHTAAVLILLSINPALCCSKKKIGLKMFHLRKLQSAVLFTHSAAYRPLITGGFWLAGSLDCIPDVFWVEVGL